MSRLPDRISILRFRHLLERHQLADQFLLTVNAQRCAQGYLFKEGTAVDAANSHAQLNEEAMRRTRPRTAVRPRRAANGTSA